MGNAVYEWIAPCHFGLEAVCKREVESLGLEVSRVEDGKVTFLAGAEGGCRANIFLRTAERVLLKAASFTATSFDELFERTKAVPWEEIIPKNGRFWVTKATSVSSRLFSPSDIQSIMKKAIVERLKSVYRVEWFEETGASYPIRVNIIKDVVTVGVDTSGDSLHKRGYRTWVSAAPITETLAAALIMLTPWRGDRILVDPFCGSGTFCIEAALMAANIAPGVERNFTAESWDGLMPKKLWSAARDEALSLEKDPGETDIQGYDIDEKVVKAARSNARNAGVDHLIHFQQRPVSELSHPRKYGFLFMNPPYGERLASAGSASASDSDAVRGGRHSSFASVPAAGRSGRHNSSALELGAGQDELAGIYREIGERMKKLDTWSAYIITAYEDAERYIGRRADKTRKIYNGMIKTKFLQYPGPKPPKRKMAGGE